MNNSKVIKSTRALRREIRYTRLGKIVPIKEFLKSLDTCAQNIIKDIDIPDMYFQIEPVSLQNLGIALITKEETGHFPICRVLYSAGSEDATAYLLNIACKQDDNSDTLDMLANLSRKNRYSTAEVYNVKKHVWEKDCCLDRLLNSEIDETAESSVVNALENGFGIPITLCGTKAVCNELDKNKKLISLVNSLDGRGMIKLLDVQMNNAESGVEFIPVVTASDPCLVGAGVLLNDNGEYTLCSLNNDMEISERNGLYFANVENGVRKITSVKDECKFISFLKKIWTPPTDEKVHILTPVAEDKCTEKKAEISSFYFNLGNEEE